jgi:prepilin-type N-terminal cleavage/methylation domain-containing protein
MITWNIRHRKFAPPRRRRSGLTLVEVMAALIILGGAVTIMLVAQARSVNQFHAAQRSLSAGRIAGELLANWKLTGEDLTKAASGIVQNEPDWRWERYARPLMRFDDLDVTEVQLTLYHAANAGPISFWSRGFHWWIRTEKEQ